jgi:predicted glycosyltransferase involved in capsule biosynthesis
VDNNGLSIILPFKTDCGGIKDRHLQYTINRYNLLLPGAEIIVATDDSNNDKFGWYSFNKSKALNKGIKRAKNNNLLIIDVDIVLPHDSILKAMSQIDKHSIIFLFTNLYKLNRVDADGIISTPPTFSLPLVDLSAQTLNRRINLHANGCYMITKERYIACGQHDERFVGWGAEDSAFIIAADTMCDLPFLRLDEDAYHLWHPKGPDRILPDHLRASKRALYLKYLSFLHNKDGLCSVLNEDGRISK